MGGALWVERVRILRDVARAIPTHALAAAVLRDLLLVVAALTIALLAPAALRRLADRRQRGITFDLLPPEDSELALADWVAFFRGLFGMARPWWKRCILGEPWVVFRYVVEAGGTRARCWCPEHLEALLRSLLRTAAPGMEINVAQDQVPQGGPAAHTRLRLWREALYPLASPRGDNLRGILGALATTGSGVYELTVQPDVHWQGEAQRRLDQLAGIGTSSNPLSGILSELLDIFAGPLLRKAASPPHLGKSTRHSSPPGDKAGEPGYRVEARLRVSAQSSAQSKAAMQALTSAFRTLDGGNGLRPARVWRGRRFDRDIAESRPPRTKSLTLCAEELAHLFHLPCPGAALLTAPVRVAPVALPTGGGRVLCIGDDDGRTPVTVSQVDLRHHIHVIGATGSGKSTELANLGLGAIANNVGVGVIDPKGDLVRDLLQRIPRSLAGRVVLIDPAERDYPIGLNVLDCPDPDLREVVCDSVVTIFRKNYERFWGPRTDDVMRAAVLTLLHRPGLTLCEIPLLLLHPEGRTKLVGKLNDPVGLDAFWEEYDRMGETQRLQMVGPLLNKLRTFLLRRTVRNMLGQPRSTVDLQRVMDEGGIILISLAKGLLGEETSRLLGSFMVARIWQAALTRADRPENLRPDFNLLLDEFQTYLHLPQSLGEILAEARGYHLSLTLANQHLGQLSRETVEALSANARTRMVFQCGQEDARYLAKEFQPWMSELQLRNLQPHQVAVRLYSGGRTLPPFTGMTRPLPEPPLDSDAEQLRRTALRRFGRAREVVEAEIVARYRGTAMAPVSPPPDDSHEDEVPVVEDGPDNGLQQLQQETLHLLQPSADDLP
jgi:hypothetical protein